MSALGQKQTCAVQWVMSAPALKADIVPSSPGELLIAKALVFEAFPQISGDRGKPLTKESFGNLFRKAVRAAGIKGRSAHGLRKVGATRAAENGATVAELEAIFGWRGGRMASLYTEAANRARLSRQAMNKLAANLRDVFVHKSEAHTGGLCVGQRVSFVLGDNTRNGKKCAVRVTVIEEAKAPPRFGDAISA
jgi:Phage integrase family